MAVIAAVAVSPPVGYQAGSYYGNLVSGGGTPHGSSAGGNSGNAPANADKVTISGAAANGTAANGTAANGEDPATQREVDRLKQREQHVINHEMAHESVGGRYAGAPTYTYTKGPDGKSYISGGEVSIDVSKAKTPEETVAKMRQVRASALAPSDPSPQDEDVAQKASQIEAEAEQEIARKQFTGSGGQSPYSKSTANSTGTNTATKSHISVYA
ncbi:MAG: hypothetical protein HQK99_03630 [Nitrospirae bacterium]|nr:hypothetical protein [Nitrospirota bacterium]